MTRLLRSPKILIGLCLSAVFAIVAIIGPLVAPYNPNASASTTVSTPQPPSAAHWLGTTQVQQDVLSQLLVGGRSDDPGFGHGRGGGDRAGRAVRRDRGLLRRRD